MVTRYLVSLAGTLVIGVCLGTYLATHYGSCR